MPCDGFWHFRKLPKTPELHTRCHKRPLGLSLLQNGRLADDARTVKCSANRCSCIVAFGFHHDGHVGMPSRTPSCASHITMMRWLLSICKDYFHCNCSLHIKMIIIVSSSCKPKAYLKGWCCSRILVCLRVRSETRCNLIDQGEEFVRRHLERG